MTKRCTILAWLLLLPAFYLAAQDAESYLAEGNLKYRSAQYAEAEQAYAAGIRLSPERLEIRYNRAAALVRLKREEEAIKEWDDIAFKTLDAGMKAKAYYNKGVVLSGQKRLDESIEAYKNALRYDPSDKQARENLQKALHEKKKQQPRQQKQQQPKPQKQQQQPRMSEQEARRRLELLEQKEKNVKDRLQKQKSRAGGQPNDW